MGRSSLRSNYSMDFPMTDSKQSIVVHQTYQRLREFNVQVASLLYSADAIMQNLSWHAASNSDRCQAGQTNTLSQSHSWLPREFFRFFKKSDRPELLACISVLVDDWGDGNELGEVLVTSVCVDYGKPNKVGDNWHYWYSHWHLLMMDRNDEGVICTNPYEGKPEHVQRAWTLGRPIDEITNAAKLQSLVAEPLLEAIDSADGR